MGTVFARHAIRKVGVFYRRAPEGFPMIACNLKNDQVLGGSAAVDVDCEYGARGEPEKSVHCSGALGLL